MIVSDKQNEIVDEFGELPDVNMSLGYSKKNVCPDYMRTY